jgi:hypothetical protein
MLEASYIGHLRFPYWTTPPQQLLGARIGYCELVALGSIFGGCCCVWSSKALLYWFCFGEVRLLTFWMAAQTRGIRHGRCRIGAWFAEGFQWTLSLLWGCCGCGRGPAI